MKRFLCIVVLLGIGFESVWTGDAKPAKETPEYYGRTPKEYLPYGQFTEPYKRFFMQPLEYNGYGRHIPEPTDVETVKIGFIGPIMKTVSVATGGVSHEEILGVKMLQGAKLAIKHANEQHEYRGKIPYELVVKNDNGLWGSSGNEIVSLAYKDKVWAILGTIDGANSHIAIRVALKAEIPIMNSGDTDPTFTETKIPWAFRCITDDRQMCYLLADYVYKKLELKKVAALRASNRYGRMSIDEFRDASTRLGHPFITELQYRVGDEDFTPQLERIQHLGADGVVTYGDARESALILKQMRRMGMKQWFIMSDRAVSDEFLELTGGNLDHVVAGYPYDPTSKDEKHVAFAKAFIAEYGEAPDAYAAHAYDGIMMMVDAIETAGLNRAKIRDALEAMKTYHGVTGIKEFDFIHNDISSAVLAVGENDRFAFYSRGKLFQ